MGGYGTAGTLPYIYPRFLSAVEEYNPARDMWVARPDSRAARYYLSAIGTMQGEVYAVGGYGVAATGVCRQPRFCTARPRCRPAAARRSPRCVPRLQQDLSKFQFRLLAC